MKIARNMEAIFVVAVILACAATFATVATSEIHGLAAYVSSNTKSQTVTVTAKHMTKAEKARYDHQ